MTDSDQAHSQEEHSKEEHKIEARCSLCKCNSYITLKGGSCLRYQVRDDFSTLVIATPVTRRRFSIVPRSSICGRRSRRASHLGDTTCCRCDQPRESNIGTSEGWLRACPNRVKINFALVWEIQVTVSPSVCLLRSVVSNICSFFFFYSKIVPTWLSSESAVTLFISFLAPA